MEMVFGWTETMLSTMRRISLRLRTRSREIALHVIGKASARSFALVPPPDYTTRRGASFMQLGT
jgi:hypothetical protein